MLGLLLALQVATTCQTDYFGVTHCHTNAPPPNPYAGLGSPNIGNAVNDGFARGQQMARDAELARMAKMQRKAQERGRKAGQMVAAGDCKGAEQFALTEGDLDLATTIKNYCAAPRP